MLKKLNIFSKFKAFIKKQTQLNLSLSHKLEKSFELNGKILAELNNSIKKELIINNIQKAEFSVYSQFGDDGIINFLINYLDIENKTFVEFGVESYVECNTKFLLVNDNWSGFIIDGSKENINSVINSPLFWKYDLRAESIFVTAENINSILQQNNIIGEIGLLHIDIDGNDY